MQRKGTSTVVEAKEVAEALSKRTVAPEDEKILRMRYGAKVDPSVPLPRHGGSEELEDELLLMEVELFRAFRAHQARQAKAAAKPTPRPSRTKDKIVRALRKKH